MSWIISLDIETAGLDPTVHSLLEVAAVAFDPEQMEKVGVKYDHQGLIVNEGHSFYQELHMYVAESPIIGEPRALQMAADNNLLNILGDEAVKKFPIGLVIHNLNSFMIAHSPDGRGRIIGKNAAGFDIPFLRTKAASVGAELKGFSHRIVDIGTLDFHPVHSDWVLSSHELMEKYDVEVANEHRALDDAIAVASVYMKMRRDWRSANP